jgi:hypothetical protein
MVIARSKMAAAEKVLIAVALTITIAITLWPAVAVTTGIIAWPLAVGTQWVAIVLIVACRRPLSGLIGRFLDRSRR